MRGVFTVIQRNSLCMHGKQLRPAGIFKRVTISDWLTELTGTFQQELYREMCKENEKGRCHAKVCLVCTIECIVRNSNIFILQSMVVKKINDQNLKKNW